MKIVVFFLGMILFAACSSSRGERKTIRDIPIFTVADNKSYGYTKDNPIKTGFGPRGERSYLRKLLGPNGETVTFKRLGSCCPFKIKSNRMGLLDKYEVTYSGLKNPIILYLNMYEYEAPMAPVGFSFIGKLILKK